MKTNRSKPHYGVLTLSRPTLRRLQSEWQPVEPAYSLALFTLRTNEMSLLPTPRNRTHRAAA